MEPERPIEKALREAAKKRREELGAPIEIHPATRNLLQGEVARQFKPSRGSQRSGWRLSLWPGLAFALVLVLVGYFGFETLLKRLQASSSQFSLAKNESERVPAISKSSELSSTVPSEKPALAVNAPAYNPADEEAKLTASRQPGQAFGGLAGVNNSRTDLSSADKRQAPTAAGGRPEADALNQQLGLADKADKKSAQTPADVALLDSTAQQKAPALREESMLRSRAAAAPPSAALSADVSAANRLEKAKTVAEDSFKDTDSAFRERSGVRPLSEQEFQTVTRRLQAGAASVASGVDTQLLSSFVVQQMPTELRIIDQDGSVYRQVAETRDVSQTSVRGLDRNAASESRKVESVSEPEGPVALKNLFFHVSGTNRTLSQRVDFTGNLWTPRDQQLPTGTVSNRAYFFSAAQRGSATNANFQNQMQILGKLRIGTSREIDINAIPASRP
jgi:hypothetical protein